MTLRETLHWFSEPGFVVLLLGFFSSAFVLSAKANPFWQLIACIFFGGFLITNWSEGTVWSMAMFWIYAGWVGFLFQKVGGGHLLEGIAKRIGERLQRFGEEGNPQSSPPPEAQSRTDQDHNTSRERDYWQKQAAYEKRERERMEREKNARRQDSSSREEDPKPKKKSQNQERPPESKPEAKKRPWWEVLEIPRGSDTSTIKKAYREKVRKYHPDMVSHLGDEFRVIAEQKAKEINAAYQEALSG